MTTLLEFKENPGGRPAVNFSFHPEEENGGEKKEIHTIEAGMVGRHTADKEPCGRGWGVL